VNRDWSRELEVSRGWSGELAVGRDWSGEIAVSRDWSDVPAVNHDWSPAPAFSPQRGAHQGLRLVHSSAQPETFEVTDPTKRVRQPVYPAA
jgi:hypothetical protein